MRTLLVKFHDNLEVDEVFWASLRPMPRLQCMQFHDSVYDGHLHPLAEQAQWCTCLSLQELGV